MEKLAGMGGERSFADATANGEVARRQRTLTGAAGALSHPHVGSGEIGLRMMEPPAASSSAKKIGLQWARKFGQEFANQIRRRLPWVSDKWHLGKVAPRSRV